MIRSLLLSSILVIASIAVVAIVAIVMTVTPEDAGPASSPVVSTHESSGIEMQSTSPNPNASGHTSVAPEPYRQTPVTTCEVSYISTIGDKNILKYGTTEHCGNGSESQPQSAPQSGAEVNA